MCTCDIIVCLDDDDYYPPERISEAVDKLSNSTSLIAGVSDVYTLAIRTLDATPTGDAWGAISFYDLTTQ